jgi:hypothetical protein
MGGHSKSIVFGNSASKKCGIGKSFMLDALDFVFNFIDCVI